jgi:ketosteroid isomerase-like protein
MKKSSRFFAFSTASLLLTAVFTSCSMNNNNSETLEVPKPATVEELGQMNRDFAKALVAKDAIAASLVYDENASLLPPNEPIISGRKNIQDYWQGAIDAGLIDASVQTIDAKSDGDLGYEIGYFELKFLGENGDTIIDIGKYTEILRRNAEGSWISTYGMWSNNEPLPAH